MSTIDDNDISNEEVVEAVKQIAQNGPVTQLEPVSPEKALERYLDANPEENKSNTMDTHESRLRYFVRWCDENGVTNLNELARSDVMNFYEWRKSDLRTKGDDGLSKKTLATNMDTLRVFLRYCRSKEEVSENIPDEVPEVDLETSDEVREDIVEQEKAKEIVNYLGKYHYASLEHVVWYILASTGIRQSSLHSLDVNDFHRSSKEDDAYLNLEHRPKTDTELKNGTAGEREVAISDKLEAVLEDYIDEHRPEVTDEYGRKPLIASENGRLAKSTIRNIAYRWTCPCTMTGDCPYGKEIADCDAANRNNDASKCEGSSATHAIRRGYITQLCREGIPKQIISDRVDATVDILKKHYDVSTKSEQRRVRVAALKAGEEEAGSDGFL